MPQTTGLPAGPTSTHRTQTTNYNCKPNAPGAPPRREGAWCRLSGTSFSAPRGAGCLPGVLVVSPSECWLSAPRSAGCRPQCAGCLPSELFVLHERHLCLPSELFVLLERSLSPSRCHLPLFPSTKMPILCSKRPKMGVPKPKSAQKPRFCARKARKRGSRRQKAHKNPDFVLETPENEGSEGQKRTKMPILCSNS